MEQKQLDELDESYFEEFVDEDPLEDVKISPAKPKKAKKSAKKAPKKEKVADKIEITPVKEAEPVKELEKEIPKVEEQKVVDTAASVDPWESEKVHDPWDDDEDDGEGFFKEVSTWKAITGIVVVLLIFSVFTQGFQFTEGVSPTGAAINSVDAENKVLAYVNNNLLQPPFVAEVVNSEDVGNLYRVSLTVAGQEVDSYITKDGELFFPQGFDTSLDPLTGESNLENVIEQPTEVVVEEPVVEEPTEVVVEEPVVEKPAEEVVEAPVVEEKPVVPASTKSLSVAAKKWLFEPEVLKVNQGDLVKLTIAPTGLDFTFAIVDLGVSQEVKGETTVEFTADQKGSFAVSCASCEDWRGMSGTLVVE